jgi:hypothetical protein
MGPNSRYSVVSPTSLPPNVGKLFWVGMKTWPDPESVLTPQGPHLLANFLRQAGEGEASRLDDATGSFATAGLAEVAEAVEVAR